MSARFISLEGGEGVGKSTQAHRLAEALRVRGIDVLLTREPGGSPGAEAIRALLLEGDANRWSPGAEALLFAAARADHVVKTIEPALAAGRWVICDRFLDSSRAYQGVAGHVGDAAIENLHHVGSDGLLPDRTLVLSLTEADAARRADQRDAGQPDRIGARETDFHARVAQAFRDFARDDPERIRLVNADGAEQQVTERLLAAISDLLP